MKNANLASLVSLFSFFSRGAASNALLTLMALLPNIVRIISCLALATGVGMAAHAESELGAVALHQATLDLGTDLRLMCVAAHPDDEDSATLALYRKKYGYKTIALIATRGEGGQNEIGPELYSELGVIRTHEMKRASEITGAELHFLDMPEFGYSKSRDEAYAVWGETETLRRMVRKIRETRPDVIITHHGPTGGHGHHQAVGDTLLKAFDAAADPAMFPEQLSEGLEPWQAARLYRRSFRGGDGGAAAQSDIGELDPVRGFTYAEIAGQALREHESQGMGMFVGRFMGRRNSSYGLAKEAPGGAMGATGDIYSPGGALFEGLKDRVSVEARRLSKGGEIQADEILELVARNTDQADTWKRANRLATTALGIQLKALVDDTTAIPGQTIEVQVRLIDFGEAEVDDVTFSVAMSPWFKAGPVAAVQRTVGDGQEATATFSVTIPPNQPPTIPHPDHLFDPHFFEAQLTVVASIDAGGTALELRAPLLIDVAPAVSLEFANAPYLVRRKVDDEARFELLVTNYAPEGREVTVDISAPEGFSISPSQLRVQFDAEGGQQMVPIVARIDKNLRSGDYSLRATVRDGSAAADGTIRVVDLSIPENIRVGIIESYDNTFMKTLDRFGVPHEALSLGDFTAERLAEFSTIIVDIRAYLVRPDLVANNQTLLDYVHGGGTVIVMYHKTFEWKPGFAPYPIQVSRNRVTLEDAPIEILIPGHPLFNVPNRIEASDWDGWIQERGLYFPSKWDERYQALIACADPGESPPPGSCLIAEYGDGVYMYTALGWYRQLRELHPGTVRIFANMLAL